MEGLRSGADLERRHAAFDAAVGAGVVLLTQVEVWSQGGDGLGTKAAISAALLVATLSLVWRRSAALVCAVLLGSALAIQAGLSGTDYQSLGTTLALLIGLYSAGAYLNMPRAVIAFAALVGGLAARELRDLSGYTQDPGNAAFWWLLVLTSFGVGVYVRSRRRAHRLGRLADQIEVESAENARVAVEEERARIARELHDVVAHDVSAVVVQAEAAEEMFSNQPDRALESVQTIKRLSREALGQMRQALGIVRGEASDGIPAPQPSLADLPALVQRNRDAGLSTELRIDGTARPLPPGLELSGYRVVQEALTNIRKHAGDARALVILRYSTASFEIEISDNGLGMYAAEESSGHGLIGMRERVTFFGGALTTGVREGGGFAVTATFPVPAAAE